MGPDYEVRYMAIKQVSKEQHAQVHKIARQVLPEWAERHEFQEEAREASEKLQAGLKPGASFQYGSLSGTNYVNHEMALFTDAFQSRVSTMPYEKEPKRAESARQIAANLEALRLIRQRVVGEHGKDHPWLSEDMEKRYDLVIGLSRIVANEPSAQNVSVMVDACRELQREILTGAGTAYHVVSADEK